MTQGYGKRTGLKLAECLILVTFYITSQFVSFFHWMVFNLSFYCARDSENDLLISEISVNRITKINWPLAINKPKI